MTREVRPNARNLSAALLPIGAFAAAVVAIAAIASPALSGIAILAGVYVLVLLRWPAVALFGGIVAYCAMQGVVGAGESISLGGMTINPARVFVPALAATFALRLLAGARAGLPRPPRSLLVQAVFLSWAVLCCIRGPAPAAEAGTVAKIGTVALMAYVAFAFARRWRGWVELTVAAGSVAAAVGAVIDRLSYGPADELLRVGAVRVEGTFGGAVATATIAYCGVPVFISWWSRRESRLHRIGAVIVGVGFVAALASTLTRTVVVGLLVFVTLIALSSARGASWSKVRRIGFVVAAVGVILAAVVYIVPSSDLEARAADLPGLSAGGGVNPNLGSGRGMLWLATLELIKRSSPIEWLIGHGVGGGLRDLQAYTRAPFGTHNSYLEVFYDMGAVGLALFVILLVTTVKDLRAAERSRVEKGDVRLWSSYFISYALSTIMFNGYVYGIGPRFFTYIGVGLALGMAASQKGGGERRHEGSV